MTRKKLNSATIVIFLLLSLFIISNNVSAKDDDLSIIANATFNIEMISATDFKTNIEISVMSAVAFGEIYDAAEIQGLVSSDPEALGVIKNNIHISVGEQLENVFGNDNIHPQLNRPTYEDNLFHEEYIINLTSSFFDINESINTYEFINGVLDMGGNITYTFNLFADNGWNNTYTFYLTDKMGVNRTTTTNVNEGNTEITWYVLNGMGTNYEKEAILSIYYPESTTQPTSSEDIFIDFQIDSTTGSPIPLSLIIKLRNINIEQYDFLPSFVDNLVTIPSDGIRLFIENGLISWEELKEKTIDKLEEEIISYLETPIFNQTLDFDFEWDNTTTTDVNIAYELENMNNKPAVKAVLTDEDIDLKLIDIPAKAVFGLINAGATATINEGDINLGEKLKDMKYDYNISLKMPEKVKIDDKNPYIWNSTIVFEGEVKSDNPPSYSEQEIRTNIEIEVKNTDLNLLSFFTGDTQLTLGLNINQDSNYNVTELPEEIQPPNPDKIKLKYYNSDALRVCIQEGVFTEEMISNFLNSEKTGFENRLKKIIKNLMISSNINRQTFEDSLQWDQDISKMDKEIPVTTSMYSHISHPISYGLSIAPPGFNIPTQKYNFTGIQGQSVSYKMIFPNGVDISVYDDASEAIVKELSDGRKYFEITFSEDEYNKYVEVNCDIKPSALYIVALFTPCIISLVIVIILLILILILRRKRKTRKTGIPPPSYDEPVEQDYDSYENEDYYIPPPPGSKK